MGARDVTLGSIFDAAKWVKDAVAVARRSPPGSPERNAKLDQLAMVAVRARVEADSRRGGASTGLQIILRCAEAGIDYLKNPSKPRGRHAQASDETK
jgi:hypothetical protein